MRLVKEIVFFGLSGICGFFVDTAVLYAMKDRLGPFVARGVSFFAAVIATWIFNRTFTFRQRRSGMAKRNEFLAYLVLMVGGGVVNYAVYAWLVSTYQVVLRNVVIGVAAGSLAGMTVNFATSRLILYRQSLRRSPRNGC